MAKVDQNACLSTSKSSSMSLAASSQKPLPRVPPPPPPPLKTGHERDSMPRSYTGEEDGRGSRDEGGAELPLPSLPPQHTPLKNGGGRADYILVLCYVLVYLELAWLILSLLRNFSSAQSSSTVGA